ncbi:hypothetical protein [Sorangium sp. So ce1099]
MDLDVRIAFVSVAAATLSATFADQGMSRHAGRAYRRAATVER